jgi:hypothetical protein
MLDSSIRPGLAQAHSADGLPNAGRVADMYRGLIRRVGGTRWFAWLGIHVLTRADKWLFPRFHGHVVSAGPPIFPLLQLTTTGRRSGLPRQTPLIYLADGDKLIVVASNWGQPHHPAWSAIHAQQSRSRADSWRSPPGSPLRRKDEICGRGCSLCTHRIGRMPREVDVTCGSSCLRPVLEKHDRVGRRGESLPPSNAT